MWRYLDGLTNACRSHEAATVDIRRDCRTLFELLQVRATRKKKT